MNVAKLVKRKPTPTEFISLRRAVGWLVPDYEAAEEAIARSLYTVCIEKDNRCIGMGRVVGDASLVFLVQDVIVHPEHRRKGYGGIIMDDIMDFINHTAKPTAYIALFSARGLESWYGRYGFIERPHQNLGPGMVFFKTA